jgi:hypothetical protein
MALLDTFNADLITALKSGDKVATETLRFLISEARNKRIELMHELTDEELTAVVSKEIKRRKESIEIFEKAQRLDLVENEKAQMTVLKRYQPEQMSEEEIDKIVEEEIKKFGNPSKEFVGPLTGKVMARVPKGSVDGAVVSRLLVQKLK